MTSARAGVGVYCVAAAPEYDGVAGLQAERRDIDGYVGPTLVYDSHDAERHAAAADVEAVRHRLHFYGLTDRVGERGNASNVVGDCGKPLGIEHHAVEVVRLQPLGFAVLQVPLVGFEYLFLARFETLGDVQQRLSPDASTDLC